MKSNIFRLMETEIWDGISERLQFFLIRLSLIGHLSVDLIALLAGKDKDLIHELERENAYVRRDSYINAYLIHPLFLEFLTTKQELLPEEQKRETYTIAGQWCKTNGFKIDALSYYEKVEDYNSIVDVFIGSQSQIPYDIACFTAGILERAQPEVFDNVLFLASIHIRTIMSQGLWKDAIKLVKYYEARYIDLPADDTYRKLTLSSIYYYWGFIRAAMCLTDDTYDFDLCYEKVDKCFSEPFDPGILINQNPGGPWVCTVGTSRKGAPEEYLGALKRSTAYLTHCYIGFESGNNELACAELMFYKGDTNATETYITRALDIARKTRQFGIIHRALFYMLRIAIFKGNYPVVEQALKELKVNLDKPGYSNRFVDYDITMCWYYCTIGLPEKTPDWLKENYTPYAFAGFTENYANMAKACYCYVTRNFPPLLAYFQELKQRESFLFGRAELLAIEACIHYKMKDKEKACAVLKEAYEISSPNDLVMPFIEMGKDMRTLTAFALKKTGLKEPSGIPRPWLESINRKSASYSKRLAHIIARYKQTSGMMNGLAISPRESDILSDLAHGLSRAEIAASRSLSPNTVKMVINNLYTKMGAENLADLIRIATVRKMI
jgi:LuxR family maltose regulon positive regulatory protein